MKVRFFLTALWLTLSFLGNARAQDAFAQNRLLARTLNFGNALEAPNEGAWGLYLAESDFETVKEAGFSAIRLPINWATHADLEAPYGIDASFFKRIDWAVEQAVSRDLALILDMHNFEALMLDPASQKERFLTLWQQVAEHYRDAPPQIMFELLNEPHGAMNEVWNEYLAAALAVVRESNPARTVIVGPTRWNGIDDLDGLELPADPNLIVTIHNYEPFHFTHQGAGWVEGGSDWLGTVWEGTKEEVAAVQERLDRAAAWGEDHNRPLFMGEFGAYSKADVASRARWTRELREEAEARGISWGYWEYASGFGLYNRGNKRWNEALLSALLD